ncbi:uncharacterized protein LOC106087676 [Stomoxys calcitrans]|uniref:uncharacterized protein LOC106087676 n=1 Tax=Stomoxys calcitrans TaxID=35570 RepID=UPI0027E30293|nr:uncharacterized protein LOC106087676 [Stomoxys calcitrans]
MRSFSDNSKLSSIGGGLEKLQGGLKEETYFQTQNYDLINKIREQGSKLKCESCINEWPAFEKVLESAVPTKTALRESCSVNRHKNCLEEAFFLEEQNDCAKIIKVKLSEESKESMVQFEIQTKCKQMQE